MYNFKLDNINNDICPFLIDYKFTSNKKTIEATKKDNFHYLQIMCLFLILVLISNLITFKHQIKNILHMSRIN